MCRRIHWELKLSLKILFVACAVLLLVLAACTPASQTPTTVTVFAASSLTNAFDEIATEFEAAHDDVDVVNNFGSSSELALQITEGAPVDIFASANNTQMQVAVGAGRISGQPKEFLTNRLTIIVPADNPAKIHSLADLAQPGIALVLAAPGVPIRDYSDQSISLMGDTNFQAAVYANLASEEPNVRQVATKVALGEADAGIVYVSDITPDIADQVMQIVIPDEQNVIAVYPIAVVDGVPSGSLAEEYVDFVLSAEGQAILAKWGFGPKP
jgi:molybdate transport system substrate-binding protein